MYHRIRGRLTQMSAFGAPRRPSPLPNTKHSYSNPQWLCFHQPRARNFVLRSACPAVQDNFQDLVAPGTSYDSIRSSKSGQAGRMESILSRSYYLTRTPCGAKLYRYTPSRELEKASGRPHCPAREERPSLSKTGGLLPYTDRRRGEGK